jgi:hypothetical protein
MAAIKLFETIRLNERVSVLFSHLLVSLMLACFAVSIAQFAGRLSGWNGWYLPWVVFFVSLEATYAHRMTRNTTGLDTDWLIYRGVELVVIFIGLKALLYIVNMPAQLLSDLGAWQRNFLTGFFTAEYLALLVVLLLFWGLSLRFSDEILRMEGDLSLLGDEIPVGIAEDRMRAREQMADMIVVIGAIMVILATGVRIELRQVWGDRPPLDASVVNLVLYFVFALALFGQTQLSILRASWSWERTPLSRNLSARWIGYSLLFLLLLGGLALILPTSYSLGLITVLGYLLSWLVYGIMMLWGLIFLAITSLLGLFGAEPNRQQQETAPPVMPAMPQLTATPQQPLPWLEVLKSVLFWVVFLGVVGFSIYQYLSQNQELWARLRQVPGMDWLLAGWRWLRAWLAGVNRSVGSAVSEGLKRLRRPARASTVKEAWRFVNVRRLPPRQRILFFYLALVRRGQEQGLARGKDQTPYEYQQALRGALPDAEEDLAGLTASFVEARYSQHPISPDEASRAQRWWQHVRRVLRRWSGKPQMDPINTDDLDGRRKISPPRR